MDTPRQRTEKMTEGQVLLVFAGILMAASIIAWGLLERERNKREEQQMLERLLYLSSGPARLTAKAADRLNPFRKG